MKRTDIHRPSAINPQEYEFVSIIAPVGEVGICDIKAVRMELNAKLAHMQRTGGQPSRHEHGGGCDICGAYFMWGAVFYHKATNVYISIGHNCADKMDMDDGGAFRRVKTAVDAARKSIKGKLKAEGVLAAASLSKCWDIYVKYNHGNQEIDPEDYRAQANWERSHREENTICDIVQKLIKYGSISEAQTKFLYSLLERIVNREAIEAKRAAERATAEDCPTGRVQIAGTVVKISVVDSDFGICTKMTLKDDRGFLVYMSVPKELSTIPVSGDAEGKTRELTRGDKISVVVTVTPSDTDSKFGFGKRPSKASLLEMK